MSSTTVRKTDSLWARRSVAVEFTAGQRRVSLQRGEAHFTVAKDRSRPFPVSAGGMSVRAVGTAFNVALMSNCLEVLVTEGNVKVEQSRRSQPAPMNVSEQPPAADGCGESLRRTAPD